MHALLPSPHFLLLMLLPKKVSYTWIFVLLVTVWHGKLTACNFGAFLSVCYRMSRFWCTSFTKEGPPCGNAEEPLCRNYSESPREDTARQCKIFLDKFLIVQDLISAVKKKKFRCQIRTQSHDVIFDIMCCDLFIVAYICYFLVYGRVIKLILWRCSRKRKNWKGDNVKVS